MSSSYRCLKHKLLLNTDIGNSFVSCQIYNKCDKAIIDSVFQSKATDPSKGWMNELRNKGRTGTLESGPQLCCRLSEQPRTNTEPLAVFCNQTGANYPQPVSDITVTMTHHKNI